MKVASKANNYFVFYNQIFNKSNIIGHFTTWLKYFLINWYYIQQLSTVGFTIEYLCSCFNEFVHMPGFYWGNVTE